mmetsp:Transcript_12410/g.30499  ORF Transcript_12410/g.30499 Transcript_12410/m.30499 type:complete len:200 (-) Transcript_12410:705-1304(-)
MHSWRSCRRASCLSSWRRRTSGTATFTGCTSCRPRRTRAPSWRSVPRRVLRRRTSPGTTTATLPLPLALAQARLAAAGALLMPQVPPAAQLTQARRLMMALLQVLQHWRLWRPSSRCPCPPCQRRRCQSPLARMLLSSLRLPLKQLRRGLPREARRRSHLPQHQAPRSRLRRQRRQRRHRPHQRRPRRVHRQATAGQAP